MPSYQPAEQLHRLIHLEDDAGDADLLSALVRETWPHCEIQLVATSTAFVSALQARQYDLILSDYTLPTFNGLDALALAQTHQPDTPFIFLSGTIGEERAVMALQRGAVDYVLKDRPVRLIPAIERALAVRREQQLRLAAETRLREQAELLDNAQEAILVTDLAGRVTYHNNAAVDFLGLVGASERFLHELFRLSHPSRLEEARRQLLGTGVWKGELLLTHATGRLCHVDSRWTLVRDEAGHPKSILLINTDVTDKKQLESQLLRSQRMESIGTLASGVAHDLNNALSPALMAVSMLRLGLRDEDQLRLVTVLEKSIQHGSALLRQLLAFARGVEGEHTEVAPQVIIRDVVSMLADTLPRTIALETDIPRELHQVRANSTQLVQVLMNLGINARDAMPGGGRLLIHAANVELDTAALLATPGVRPGPCVRITVSDTGTGIPPELVGRIFDPFFTTKAAGKGTGLGLSMVASIIKRHGGHLQVRSEVGVGTAFTLLLPACTPVLTPATPPAPPAPAALHNGELILVIDDETNVAEVARTVLTMHGFQAICAASGEEGLQLYAQHRATVRVVVVDMMMAGLQGPEVIQRLRNTDPDVRIVAMSGIPNELAALPQDPGRLTTLAKPMTGQELIRAVQAVLPAAPGASP